MRRAKDSEGNRRFTVNEFMTTQQIQSYFSRKAQKIKKGALQPQDEHDTKAAQEETAYQDSQETILNECQLVHPIVYDTYNVCNLVTTGRLKKLSLPILRQMCEYFHMDVERVTGRRKLPYTTYLSDL